MQKEYRLSIITVNYNGLNDTCALLDCITSNDYSSSLEVIVVDNASANDEASIIEEKYPKVKVIRNNENLGFAGGNNLGIKASNGKYLFLVNNDTVINVQELDYLIERLESSDKIGMACPKIKYYFGEQKIQFAGYTPLSYITFRNKAIGNGETDNGQYDKPHITPYAHGAAMMLKREIISNVGLLPECFFLYYEELDWSVQITRKGYEIWYEPACSIYHKESQSTGQDSPLRTYYMTRNRLLFVKRNVKSTIKYLSYSYLIMVVMTRDILKYLAKGRYDLIKATAKGVVSFLKY